MANSDDIDELLKDENWNVQAILRTSQERANQTRKKKQEEVVSEISRNMEHIIQDQEQEARRENLEREKKQKEKDEIFEEISRNIEQIIQDQEQEARREKAKREKTKKEEERNSSRGRNYRENDRNSQTNNIRSRNSTRPRRKIYSDSIVKIDRTKYPRLTEPKKRNILKRLILQNEYKNGIFDDIEEDYINNKISERDLYISKTARSKAKRQYYKEIREYEDVLDDVSIREGWRKFKIGLATAALVGTSLVAVHIATNAKTQTPITSDTSFVEAEDADDGISEEEQENAKTILNEIQENVGFEMTEFTLDEQIEAVIKIREAEENLTLSKAKSYFFSIKDQDLLDEIVKSAYQESEENEAEDASVYENFSEQQKYELRKLAYELITDEEIKGYIRNPQAVKEAEERQAQKSVEDEEIGN